eukprot:2033738-Rhodomonas_salina.2
MASYSDEYKEEYNGNEYWKINFNDLNGAYADLTALGSPFENDADLQHVYDVVDRFVFLLHEKTKAALGAFDGAHLLVDTGLRMYGDKLKRSTRKKLETFFPQYQLTALFLSQE